MSCCVWVAAVDILEGSNKLNLIQTHVLETQAVASDEVRHANIHILVSSFLCLHSCVAYIRVWRHSCVAYAHM
jgi:hypothetical protein